MCISISVVCVCVCVCVRALNKYQHSMINYLMQCSKQSQLNVILVCYMYTLSKVYRGSSLLRGGVGGRGP